MMRFDSAGLAGAREPIIRMELIVTEQEAELIVAGFGKRLN
jgi:hypothetical protein